MNKLSLALCLLLASCAHAPNGTAPTAPPPAEAHRSAPLHFEEFGGRPFPYALVRASVAGKQTWMILDTGATDHVLGNALVKELGLKTRAKPVEGFDHGGATITAVEVEAPQLSLETWGAAPTAPVYAVDLPPVFEQLGIGGILAPWRLAKADEALVIDFAAKNIELIPAAGAQARLATEHRISAPKCDEPDGGRKFFLPVELGGTTAKLEIDTGASHSDVLSTSPVAAKLESGSRTEEGTSFAVSTTMQTRTVPGVAVRLGDLALTRDIDIIAAKPETGRRCGYDGVLGMDVLRACRLVIGAESIEGSCSQ